MTTAHMFGMTADGQWAPMLTTGVGGGAGGGGGGPEPTAPWTYAALTGGIVNTSDVVLVTAAGVGKSNYLTSLQIINGPAGATTEVVIKDGSTVIWRQDFIASAGIVVNFATPLYSSPNTALNAACITTSAAVYLNAQGYQDFGVTERLDAVSQYDNIYDENGGQLFDNNVNNNIIYAQ
jgi:hypothetical protein